MNSIKNRFIIITNENRKMWIFNPILKETIWGGDRIAPYKGIETDKVNIGESWELSGVEGNESIVSEGPDKGMTLPALIDKYGADLLGRHNYLKFGNRFPLLIKFIDASADLSVQVHPDDAMAQRYGMPNGKTEMWYVLNADPGARLANGFRKHVSPDNYEGLVETGDIEQELNFVEIKPGDTYFIPAGRVHAIGAGAFVAEIQQTSDATYRLYDYHRKDANGNERELHTALAKEALNFNDTDGNPVKYENPGNIPVNLVRSQYFTTNLLTLSNPVTRDYSENDSFIVLIITDGNAELHCGDNSLNVHRGQTVLIPAAASCVAITPVPSVSMLETYI